MAQHLSFDPHIDATISARDELEDLIETLHASGTLRVLNGFFGKIADVSEVAMQELDSPKGRHAMANAALLFMAFAKLDPDELEALLEGLQRGVGAAREALRAEPPSTLKLTRMLHDPETRRALYAGLAVVRSLGGAVSDDL